MVQSNVRARLSWVGRHSHCAVVAQRGAAILLIGGHSSVCRREGRKGSRSGVENAHIVGAVRYEVSERVDERTTSE